MEEMSRSSCRKDSFHVYQRIKGFHGQESDDSGTLFLLRHYRLDKNLLNPIQLATFLYLQHFVRPWRRLLPPLDLPEDPEYLVHDAAGDEAAQAGVNEFHERHRQQRHAGLNGSQDLGVSGNLF